MAEAAPGAGQITGLILSGGRGLRMGGVDKGLQPFRGKPLAAHAHARLAPQVGSVLVSANRALGDYAALGLSALPDARPDFPGPLAGIEVGLRACATDWLAVCPVDAPLAPLDWVRRLADDIAGHDIAVVTAREPGSEALRVQPVFCLLSRGVLPNLSNFVQGGGRQVQAWMAQHRTVQVPFEQPGDAEAFFNANCLADLAALG